MVTHKCTLHGPLSSCGRWFLLPTSNWLCMCCHGRRPFLKGVHIRVHFWLKVVTLNPVNNQTGKRHFICVSMATNQDFHRTLVTVANCHLPLFNFFIALYIPADHIFCLWEEIGIFIYFFSCLMPSFTKAKTFAKCPSVDKICCFLFIYFFLWTFRVKKLFTYFVMVAVGFKQLCICPLYV